MPDIRPSLGYIGKMRRFENKYLAEINVARSDFRRQALDIITRSGVKLSVLPEIRKGISGLESKITAIGRSQSMGIDEIGLWYINQQLGNLRKIGEKRLPNVQQLNLATYSERQQIYENILTGTPAWINDLARNLEINITRLAVSKADNAAAIDRLLSISIADGRASAYRLSGAAAITETKTTAWMASGSIISRLFVATQDITRTEYKKQAISAIDENTTDCCLRVHGQVQPLDKDFILTGTPRFADHLPNSPFHWNCRGATALYTEKMEEKGIATQEMLDAADAEILARQRGEKGEVWPVSSTSGRGI